MFQEMTSKLNTPFYGVELSILINSPFWELENLVYLLLLLSPPSPPSPPFPLRLLLLIYL